MSDKLNNLLQNVLCNFACSVNKSGEVIIKQVFTMAAELEYIFEMYFEKYELQNGIIFVEEKAKDRSSVNKSPSKVGRVN